MLARFEGLSMLKLLALCGIRSSPDPGHGARPWDAILQTLTITTPNRSARWRRSPARTPPARPSTASTLATPRSSSGLASASTSAVCIARPVSTGPLNGRGRCRATPSSRRRRSSGSSSVWATAARLRRRPTSVTLTPGPSTASSSRPAAAPRTSTASSSTGSRPRPRRSSSTSYTAGSVPSRRKKGAPRAGAVPSRPGARLGPGGLGGRQPVPDRPAARATRLGDGRRAGGVGGVVHPGGGCVAVAAGRQPPAVPRGAGAGPRGGPAPAAQAAAWAEGGPRPEAAARVPGRGGGEGASHLGPGDQGAGQDAVRPAQGDQGPGGRAGHRHDGQHLVPGAARRGVAEPAGASGPAWPLRLAGRASIAVVAVAVAGSLQLGAGPRGAGGTPARDGDRPDRAGLVGAGVRASSGVCRRAHPSDPGRRAGRCTGVLQNG